MRQIRSIRTWIGGAVLVFTASATAQGPGMAAPDARDLRKVDMPLGKEAEIGAEKMFEQAKMYMQKMQDTLRRGEKQREDAKRRKDLVKLNCLNEKLGQSAGHVRDAEQALVALSDAVVRNDSGERKHEFSRIRIYYQKVLVLGAEADNCAGEENSYVGPAQIEVDVDPTIPQGDPTDPGLPRPNFTTPPPGVEEAVVDSVSVNPMMMM